MTIHSQNVERMAAGVQLGPLRTTPLLASLLSLLVPSALITTNLIFEGRHCAPSGPILQQREAGHPEPHTLEVLLRLVLPFTCLGPLSTLASPASNRRCGLTERGVTQCHFLKETSVCPRSATAHLWQGIRARWWDALADQKECFGSELEGVVTVKDKVTG